MKPPDKVVEYPDTDMPAREFRRRCGRLTKQKLETLRRIWEDGQPGIRAKHDPGVAEAAMWFCDDIGWPKPPWLKKVAARFPVSQPGPLVEGRDFFIVPPNRTRRKDRPWKEWGKRQFVWGAIIAKRHEHEAIKQIKCAEAEREPPDSQVYRIEVER